MGVLKPTASSRLRQSVPSRNIREKNRASDRSTIPSTTQAALTTIPGEVHEPEINLSDLNRHRKAGTRRKRVYK